MAAGEEPVSQEAEEVEPLPPEKVRTAVGLCSAKDGWVQDGECGSRLQE